MSTPTLLRAFRFVVQLTPSPAGGSAAAAGLSATAGVAASATVGVSGSVGLSGSVGASAAIGGSGSVGVAGLSGAAGVSGSVGASASFGLSGSLGVSGSLGASAALGGTSGPLTSGAFQECSGLSLEAEIKDHLEGGRNDAVRRLVGRVKLQPITLKRGMFAATPDGYVDTRLWRWFEDMVAAEGPAQRYDGVIMVRTTFDDTPMAIWNFRRGLPLKVVGPTLNAQTGEVAIEELQIAHEGLTLTRSDPAPGASA